MIKGMAAWVCMEVLNTGTLFKVLNTGMALTCNLGDGGYQTLRQLCACGNWHVGRG